MTKKPLLLLLSATLFTQTGCGTLLYPERQGQIPGRIDPSILILDGIGLLFFLVPGLVAFAVDFGTGTIYLPGGSNYAETTDLSRRIQVTGDLDSQRLNKIIEQQFAVSNVLENESLLVSRSNGQCNTAISSSNGVSMPSSDHRCYAVRDNYQVFF